MKRTDVWRRVIPKKYRARLVKSAGLTAEYVDLPWECIPASAREWLRQTAQCELIAAAAVVSIVDDVPGDALVEYPIKADQL